MEDKKISEAIKLLYKGAKMLSYHCPDCGTPIFKYQDKMLCPSCGKEAIFESQVERITNEVESKEKSMKPIDTATEIKLEGCNERLKKVLESKLSDISELLANAKSPEDIDRLLTLLERILAILRNLREF
jgi:UPF0148 protein